MIDEIPVPTRVSAATATSTISVLLLERTGGLCRRRRWARRLALRSSSRLTLSIAEISKLCAHWPAPLTHREQARQYRKYGPQQRRKQDANRATAAWLFGPAHALVLSLPLRNGSQPARWRFKRFQHREDSLRVLHCASWMKPQGPAFTNGGNRCRQSTDRRNPGSCSQQSARQI